MDQFDSLVNFEFSPPNIVPEIYTDIQASESSFTPMNSSPTFDTWDLSLPPNIPAAYQPIEVTPINVWPSPIQNKTELLRTRGLPNTAPPFPPRDSWSPSSSSDNESEMTPQLHNIHTPSSGGEEVHPRQAVRRTKKKTKVEKAERIERRREKNRTSQRKFRERKEQYIQELESQCSDLQRRCDSLLFLLSSRGPDVREKEQWRWPDVAAAEA